MTDTSRPVPPADLPAGAVCALTAAWRVEQPTLATVAAGLRALAKADVRDLAADAARCEPFRCHRCLDLMTVPDWANWRPSWLWQRYRPVPWIPCPDCGGETP